MPNKKPVSKSEEKRLALMKQLDKKSPKKAAKLKAKPAKKLWK